MGKQINYYMDYDNFLKLAEVALGEGCMILRNEHTPYEQIPQSDISAILPEHTEYYFYLPELADLEQLRDVYGNYYVNTRRNFALIEAGFSRKREAEKCWITRSRLYIQTSDYDTDGQRIVCTERLVKVYEKLARLVRKLCPTMKIELSFGVKPYQKYLSPACAQWRSQGYELHDLLFASRISTTKKRNQG
jgi:hypothetical protein